MAHVVCFVLKPGVNRERIRAVAARAGLALANRIEGDGSRLSYEEAWAMPDRMTAVNYVEDPIVNLAYLVFRGENIDDLIGKLIPELPAFTHREALDMAKTGQTRNDQVRALYRIAVMFPEYNAEAFEVMREYSTKAQDPVLREAAVDAMVYRCWPEFIGLLEHIERNDPDKNVRQRASEILPHVRAANPSS